VRTEEARQFVFVFEWNRIGLLWIEEESRGGTRRTEGRKGVRERERKERKERKRERKRELEIFQVVEGTGCVLGCVRGQVRMENVAELLRAAQEGNAAVRDPAVAQLSALANDHYVQYLEALVQVLNADGQPPQIRQAAALEIKNLLTGKAEAFRQQKQAQWEALPEQARNHVKEVVLNVLGNSPVQVANQAAQIVEAIARFDLIEKRWENLPSRLVQIFDQVLQQDKSRISSPLLALGNFAAIAASTGYPIEQQAVDSVLSKISVGMNREMPENVQVAATEALMDTLEFAKFNMENAKERNVIMTMILEMTQTPFSEVKQRAFQCLTTVLELYYVHLSPHMNDIWTTTQAAIRNSEDENVGRQALNFWSEMCLEEADRNLRPPNPANAADSKCFNFIQQIQNDLCKLVVEYCLLQQEEEPDDDERNDNSMYGAAEHCFINLCSCLGPQINQYALQFSGANLMHQDWRHRQAAIFVFGAILRDADSIQMKGAVNEVVRPLIDRLVSIQALMQQNKADQSGRDPVATVRETAAWALSIICAFHIQVVTDENSMMMLQGLVMALADKPRVAHMAAAAIHAFAGAFQSEETPETNALSQLLNWLCGQLWDAARRTDSHEWQLMEDAYEAIIRLIEVSARDKQDFVGGVLLNASLTRLSEISEGTVEDRTGFQEVELCGIVHSCVVKLEGALFKISQQNPVDVPDLIVQTMLNILTRPRSNSHADAFGVIGEVTRVVGDKFDRYLEKVMPVMFIGLRNRENHQVCIAAVRLCADICTAMKERAHLLPFVQTMMNLIYENLRAQELHIEVKPPHLTVLGDIADAIGKKNFAPYLDDAMKTAITAAKIDLDITEAEYADYLNDLREGALEAIEMMILDLQLEELQPYVQEIVKIALQVGAEVKDPRNYYMHREAHLKPPDLAEIVIDYTPSDAVTKPILGILGDIASKAGNNFKQFLQKQESQQELTELFRRAQESDSIELREAAEYAHKQLR